MPIELTEEQRSFVIQHAGRPAEFVDPETGRLFLLIAREKYEPEKPARDDDNNLSSEEWRKKYIPEGIRLSQDALRRDLPALLEKKKLRGQWVAYNREERIGIAKNPSVLERECIKRGLESNEYYVGWIDPSELIEEEELEPRPWHSARD